MKDLRIGVIGAGGRGHLAGHAHQPEAGVRVTAVADPREDARAGARQRYGKDILATPDYRDMLARADLDAVFVCSPDFLHEEHACAALERGLTVYLEKPMAITTAGCDRILATARQAGARLYLGHNMRHFAVIRKMKELLDAGTIGQVKAAWCRHFISYGGTAYFRDWHADRSRSNGLLLQKGAHDIDVIHWLCGGYSRRVTALGGLTLYGQIQDRQATPEYGFANCGLQDGWPPASLTQLNPVVDVEDLNMMLMQLDNGVFASYQQCHFTPDCTRNYTFIGTHGRIENCGDSPGEAVVKVWTRKGYYNPYGDVQYFIPAESGGHGGADPKIVAEFVRFARAGGAVATSPIAARYSVAAGDAATASLRQGGTPMDVPPLAPELLAHFA